MGRDDRAALGPALKHEGLVNAVAFSPDGQTALTGSWDNTARLWDVKTGQPRGPALKHEETVNAVAFSPDGQTALTGSGDGTAQALVPAGKSRRLARTSPALGRGDYRADHGRPGWNAAAQG